MNDTDRLVTMIDKLADAVTIIAENYVILNRNFEILKTESATLAIRLEALENK